jgi:prepilin-type N-terminal cleavage/methylation domain-containing protein
VLKGFKQKGFTLIEFIVASGIIIFLLGIIFANYRSFGEDFLLLRSAHKLAQDIRRAAELVMSAEEFQGSVPSGYGIFLQQGDNKYILYADTNPAGGNQQYDGGDGIVETIYFEQGVYIQDVSPSPLSINFEPPNPTIRISGMLPLVEIKLSLQSNPSKTKKVKVNAAGLIDIE